MTPVWSSAVIVLAVATAAAVAPQEPYKKPLPDVSERLKGIASKYANLSPADCKKRLKETEGSEAFAFQGAQNGIATPMRVVGPVLGVNFRVPPAPIKYGVLDCRQALVWLDLAPQLKEHGVESIRIDNFYRNGARIRGGKKSQHAYGLGADIVDITFAGTGAGLGKTDVEDDFLGQLGEPVCGPQARIVPKADSDKEQVARAIRMRNLVCEWARDGAFHHILTPNYNAAHRNHLHLDIKRDNKWFSVN